MVVGSGALPACLSPWIWPIYLRLCGVITCIHISFRWVPALCQPLSPVQSSPQQYYQWYSSYFIDCSASNIHTMAAIIAQLTRTRRERLRRLALMANGDTRELRCHVSLPEFQTRFDPKIHNKYCIRHSFLLNYEYFYLVLLDERR